MKLKQTGSVFINHGLWYYAVQLPGEKRRRQVPLRAPGANHTLTADRPRKSATKVNTMRGKNGIIHAMNNHAKSALALALAIVGGIAAYSRMDMSQIVISPVDGSSGGLRI